MDASSAASEIPDLLEFLRPSVKKFCGEAQVAHEYGRDCQYIVKTIRSGAHHARSSTSMVFHKTTHQVKEEYRISKGIASDYHKTAENDTKQLIQMTVGSSKKQLKNLAKKRRSVTKTTTSNQDTCVQSNHLVVLIGKGKKEKLYTFKKTESATDINDIKFEKYVDKDQLLHCQRIVSSLNMESKKKLKSVKHDESIPHATNSQIKTNSQDIKSGGKCRGKGAIHFQNQSSKEDLNKSRVKITGKLGINQEDQFVLRCTATINGVPIPTECTGVSPAKLYTSDGQRLKTLGDASEESDYVSYRSNQRHVFVQTEIQEEKRKRKHTTEGILNSLNKNRNKVSKKYEKTGGANDLEYNKIPPPLVVISVYPSKLKTGKDLIKVHKAHPVQVDINNETAKHDRPQRSRSEKFHQSNKEIKFEKNDVSKTDNKTNRKRTPSPDHKRGDLIGVSKTEHNKRNDSSRSPVTRCRRSDNIKQNDCTLEHKKQKTSRKRIGESPTRTNSQSPNRKRNLKSPDYKPNLHKSKESSPDRKTIINNNFKSKTRGVNKAAVQTEVMNAQIKTNGFRVDEKNKDNINCRCLPNFKFDQNQVKKDLVDKFTHQINSLNDDCNKLKIRHKNNNYSSVSVNIDGKDEKYDLVFKQDGATTDFKVKRTMKYTGTQINKLDKEKEIRSNNIDLESDNEQCSDYSMENFLPNFNRTRSISHNIVGGINYMAKDDKECPITERQSSLLLKIKDSIEIAHTHERRDTHHSQQIKKKTASAQDEENYSAPMTHYRGDNCRFQDPIERENEIRQLLGIVKKRNTSFKSKSIAKQVEGVDEDNEQSRIPPANERKNLVVFGEVLAPIQGTQQTQVSPQYNLDVLHKTINSKQNINIAIVYLKRKISLPEKFKTAIQEILSKKTNDTTTNKVIITESKSPIANESAFIKVIDETDSTEIILSPKLTKSVPSLANMKNVGSELRNQLSYFSEYIDKVENEDFQYDEYISSIFSHIFKINDSDIQADDNGVLHETSNGATLTRRDVNLSNDDEVVVHTESKLVPFNEVSNGVEEYIIKASDCIVESEGFQTVNDILNEIDDKIIKSQECREESQEAVILETNNLNQSKHVLLHSDKIIVVDNDQVDGRFTQYSDYIIKFDDQANVKMVDEEDKLLHTGDYVMRLDGDETKKIKKEIQTGDCNKSHEYSTKYHVNMYESKVNLCRIEDDIIEVTDNYTQTCLETNRPPIQSSVDNEYIKYHSDYKKAVVLFDVKKSKRLKETKATLALPRSEINPCASGSSLQCNYLKSLNVQNKPVVAVKSEAGYKRILRPKIFTSSVGEGDWFNKCKNISVSSNTDFEIDRSDDRIKSKTKKKCESENVQRYAINLSVEVKRQDSFLGKIKKCVINKKPSKMTSFTKEYRRNRCSSESNHLNMYEIKTCLGAPHLHACTASTEGNSSGSSSQFVSDEEVSLKKGFLNLVFRKLRHFLMPR